MDEQIITDVIAPPGGGVSPGRTGERQEGDHVMPEDIDFDSIEQGGATAVDTAQPTVEDGPEPAGETLGEVADNLGEAAVGDLLTTEEDVQATPVLKPESVLEHDVAEDVAYAQKPRLDDIETAEAAGKLTSESKDLLEWLASEAAEKALSDYQEARSKMTPAEAVIREKVDELKVIGEHQVKLGTSDAERPDILDNARKMLAQTLDTELEQILADEDLSDRQRLTKIGELQEIKETTVVLLGDVNALNRIPEQIERSIEGNEDRAIRHYQGYAIAAISAGYIYQGTNALVRIAELSGKDTSEVIDPLLYGISRGRQNHNTHFNNGSATDSHMDRLGYLWSRTQKAYVRVVQKERDLVVPII